MRKISALIANQCMEYKTAYSMYQACCIEADKDYGVDVGIAAPIHYAVIPRHGGERGQVGKENKPAIWLLAR